MPDFSNSVQPVVMATVTEVLPRLGLAYLDDDVSGSWAVTRNTPGSGLESLRQGQRVQLAISRNARFALVSSYSPLE